MALLKNVQLVIFTATDEKITPISNSVDKDDLIDSLKKEEIQLPEVNKDEELDLQFEAPDGSICYVTLINKTSDQESEWYEHKTSDPIVIASVEREEDLVQNYEDERMEAEDDGYTLTQEEYIEQYDEENESLVDTCGEDGEDDQDGKDGEDGEDGDDPRE